MIESPQDETGPGSLRRPRSPGAGERRPFLLAILLLGVHSLACMFGSRVSFSPDGSQALFRFLEGDRSGLALHDAARGSIRHALAPEAGVDHLEAWWDPVGARFLAISIRSRRRLEVRSLDPATGATGEVASIEIPIPGPVEWFPMGPALPFRDGTGWIGPLRVTSDTGSRVTTGGSGVAATPRTSGTRYLGIHPGSGGIDAVEFRAAVLLLEPPGPGALCVELVPRDGTDPAPQSRSPPERHLARLEWPGTRTTRIARLEGTAKSLAAIPVPSPDGSRLVHLAQEGAGGLAVLIDREGKTLDRIALGVPADGAGPPTWSGETLVFVAQGPEGHVLVEVRTKDRRVRTYELAGSEGLQPGTPGVSPDGRRVLVPLQGSRGLFETGPAPPTRLAVVEIGGNVTMLTVPPASPGPTRAVPPRAIPSPTGSAAAGPVPAPVPAPTPAGPATPARSMPAQETPGLESGPGESR